MRVRAREENGSRTGNAETLGIPCRARRRPCTDSQIVSKACFGVGTEVHTDLWPVELGLAELKSRAFEAGVFGLLGVYLSLTLRPAYYQVAHRRKRPLRSLFNLFCYFRSRSEGKLLWYRCAVTTYCY